MLMPLNKLAEEVKIQEGEALRIAIYFGVPRRKGLYDEREFLLAHIRYLREKVFGFVAVENADTPGAPKKNQTPRVRVAVRHKRAATPWAGPILPG